MMKRFALLTGSAFLAAATAAPLGAAPNKPMNAATADKGTGCLVRGGESQAYAFDAACAFHVVTKADKDGNRVFLSYQDKGTLQSGQAAPDKALRLDITNTIAGQSCSGTEVITPSGNYSSNLTCK
jgi:hypothetical protein